MTFPTALAVTAHLLAFSMFLQGVEFSLLSRSRKVKEIWSRPNLEAELRAGLPMPSILVDALASGASLPVLAAAQAIVAALGLVAPSFAVFVVLFVTHFLIGIRFRGNFNGGSDMMTTVVLVGVLIAFGFSDESVGRWGLVYVAVQLLYSYFKAGLSKARHAEWRTGRALPAFLATSFFPDVRRGSRILSGFPAFSRILGWGLLAFEIGVAVVPFFPSGLKPAFLLAAVFHIANYLVFGLNRFFWAWLCAWPSVFFLSTLVSSR